MYLNVNENVDVHVNVNVMYVCQSMYPFLPMSIEHSICAGQSAHTKQPSGGQRSTGKYSAGSHPDRHLGTRLDCRSWPG